MEENLKQLLLKDLCARLPYGIKLKHLPSGDDTTLEIIGNSFVDGNIHDLIDTFKPYLRPMLEIANLISAKEYSQLGGIDLIDWYNANHIDYRGLIEKGLAIKAPKEMYN